MDDIAIVQAKVRSSWNEGLHLSEEHKKKLSVIHKRLDTRPSSPKGRKVSEATKKKMSEAQLGKKKHNYGKTTSEEVKLKISETKTGSIYTLEHRMNISVAKSGANAWNWKGGVSSKNERLRRGMQFRAWRTVVFERDDWTCRKCHEKGGCLHPHHIENFSQHLELRFVANNGITFCVGCHMRLHNKYGRQNNTAKQIEEFL